MPATTITNVSPTPADRLYRVAARAAFGLAWVVARGLGATPQALRARTGRLPPATPPLLWLHGASAGEMAAAIGLSAALRAHGHRFTAAYTAANAAGVEFVQRRGGTQAVAALAPWDHPRWVARAFDHWQPRLLLLVETELWPTLILEAARRRLPVFCVSARIYPRDAGRYRLIRALTAPMLQRLTGVLAQDDTERERFVALGMPPECCTVAGNLKYLAATGASRSHGPLPATAAWRRELHLVEGERVVVCGSIHTDELRAVFAALDQLPLDALRVIIAPRHLTATVMITRLAQRRGWRLHRRSAGSVPPGWQLLVLDRVGELAEAYAVASLAVVGGGFGAHGGHNPFEPLLAGAPVIFGPHFDHFAGEARALAAVEPTAQVDGPLQLGQRLLQWWSDPRRCARVLARQRSALPDGAAIARRYVNALSPWLERGGV
ncbi:MAG: hypothetical protein HY699_19090 [Deltaproteobacteria bacterium]|nr:hypothetical protein [Deltaproteobacteria bacterium]